MELQVALLDDYQRVARSAADWSQVDSFARVTAFHEHLAAEDLIRSLAGYQAVVAMRERTPFPREVIEALPELKLIVTTGMANASIDLAAAAENGVVVSGTRLGGTQTAELAWALIMNSLRDIPGQDREVRAGGWATIVGKNVKGSTLGVVGLGHLGKEIARIGLFFGMRVVAWSQNLRPEDAAAAGVEYLPLPELLAQSDVVSIHLKLSDRSRGLFGARELELIGPDGWLVNTSRGPIVDEAALVNALTTGTLGGAALDVFDVEPLPAGHPLRSLDNVILSPHAGYASQSGYREGYGDAVAAVVAWRSGAPIRMLN
jgi:phosphoglycerate dehydrogenase-like enzyme